MFFTVNRKVLFFSSFATARAPTEHRDRRKALSAPDVLKIYEIHRRRHHIHNSKFCAGVTIGKATTIYKILRSLVAVLLVYNSK